MAAKIKKKPLWKNYIDIGSSTIKTYTLDSDGAPDWINEKSILFKDGFKPEAGITVKNLDKRAADLAE
jgi:hypothetical protein